MDIYRMKQSKKYRLWSAIVVVLVIAATMGVGIFIGRMGERLRTHRQVEGLMLDVERSRMDLETMATLMHGAEARGSWNDKMLQTIATIRNYYVDPIDLDSIYEHAIPVLLSELDPHSEYIPAKLFESVNESLEGEFDGIGIVFNAMTDTITVLNVIPQGPSAKAGVRAGDRIILIDGREVAGQGIPQDSMVRLMRGPRGSRVKLSVARANLSELVEMEVTRDAIELHSIEAAFMLDREHGIACIRLSQFARTSHNEIRHALTRLHDEGMTALILDLRGNGGGFLDQAIAIANEFLAKDKLIVYTEDRYGNRHSEYSTGQGEYSDLELAVLVDEISASSSEILAGAMQDNDRGLVIGRRTFGKGLVQTQIPFADGSAVRLTVARYYTPTGRSIQKPYVKGDEAAYHLDLINRINNNELFSADSIHFDESMRYTTPAGRTVYGGGGIMPDIFIPLDTTGITKYYNRVWDGNILYRYTMEFADRHRAKMERIKSLEELDALLASVDIVEDFVAYAERHGVERNDTELRVSRKIIEAQLRAYIGRNAMDDSSGFYYNIFPIDDAMQRAAKELRERIDGTTKN